MIGERVQVGSDTTLVAPVTIGDDAYIATATTVRRDVSRGALAFNTREQRERAGWVAQFRALKTGKPAPAKKSKGKPKAQRARPKATATARPARRPKRRAR